MTLSDRLTTKKPSETLLLDRPSEVEEAVVKCLEVCADFNYPMRKRQL
jgi:hypothetical protein